jgi:hypothetical protein
MVLAKSATNENAGDESDLELDFGGLSLREFLAVELPKEGIAYNAQTIEDCMESLALRMGQC